MTQEEKELLLKDICARLPYRVMIKDTYSGHYGRLVEIGKTFAYFISELNGNTLDVQLYYIKPYLRPMSSMTDEERYEWMEITHAQEWLIIGNLDKATDWLNENKFDYRGLIPMGLALKAKEGMYKTE